MGGERKSSEIKSGNLILVSGTFLRKLQGEVKKNHEKIPTNHDARMLLRQKQKMTFLSKKIQKSPRRSPRSPRRGVLSGRSPVKKAVVPKTVRLSVHGNHDDPEYLVVFESTKRFARPVACVKMRDCRVTTDYYDVTKFTLAATQVGVTFVLKARSHEACKSWVQALSRNSPSVGSRDKNSHFKNRKILPPVVEEKN